jgi:hypothetical protein
MVHGRRVRQCHPSRKQRDKCHLSSDCSIQYSWELNVAASPLANEFRP